MRTRRFLILALLALWTVPDNAAAVSGAPPNVLLICVDDLNDWVGCFGGHPDVMTPNIDRLAKRGLRFTNFHCSAAVCNPSRTALFTGKRPSTTGVYSNRSPWRNALPDVVTMPQYFKQHGYRILGSGKLQHNPEEPHVWHEFHPNSVLPEEVDDSVSLTGMYRNWLDWGAVDVRVEDMPDAKNVDWAIARLRQTSDQPRFVACGLFRPHLRWYLPRSEFDRYDLDQVTLPAVREDDLEDIPARGRSIAAPEGDHKSVIDRKLWREAVRAYLAAITFADGQIGRLLEALEDRPDGSEWIVVLWSDHGWHLGEKQHWRKFTLWEEATRSILIIVAPGVTGPNTQCDRPVEAIHVYPTLADLCGLPAPADLDGVSLRPLLEDPGAAWDRPAITSRGRGNYAVRTDRWRYIRYQDGTEELYDHDRDSQEWTNLASNPRYTEIKSSLAQHIPREEAPEAPAGEQYSP